jgi:MFS family permease
MSPRSSTAAVFLVHAGIAGTLAPRIPAIKTNLDLGDGGLGVALTGFAVALFLGTRVAARMVDSFGSRRVVEVGLPLFAVCLAGPALAGDLVTLTVALVPFGIAAGLVDVAMNAQAVEVERALARPIMGSIHGFWSVGLLASSGVTAGIAAAGVSVRTNLLVAGCVFVVLGLLAPRGLLRGRRTAAPARGRGGGPIAVTVIALGVIGFCSFLGEGAAADWSGVYLNEDAGSSAGLAAFAFTAFAIGMVLSRFCADGLSARFGPVVVVRVGGILAGVGLILGLAIVEVPAVLVAFLFLGLGLAPIVPTAFSAAGNVGSGARALGWVVTMSYVGSVLGPAAIGAVAHGVGLRWGMAIPAALALVAAALAGFTRTAAGPEAAAPEPPLP